MANTRYQEYFTKLAEKKLLQVPGSTLIVEIIRDEEVRSKGGIIISAPSNHARGSIEENRLLVGKVVFSGEGYYNEETGGFDALDIPVGAIVVLPKYSMSMVSVFPGITEPTADKLGLVKENQILAFYASEKDYLEAKKLSEAE